MGSVLCIQDYQYKRYINLDRNYRLYQLDTKKMSRMISNCPVKKPYINVNTGGVFSAYQRPGQPEESGKPEVNQNTALFPKTVYKVRAK